MRIIITLAVCVIFDAYSSFAETTDLSSLKEATNNVLAALRNNEDKQFLQQCSENGILIVERSVRWDQMRSSQRQPLTNLFRNIDFDIVWQEIQIHFTLNELTSDEEFHTLFQRYRKLLKNTYPNSIIVSMSGWDDWHSRRMGPFISGKIASNCHWYMYFIEENHRWKLWRLEYAIH